MNVVKTYAPRIGCCSLPLAGTVLCFWQSAFLLIFLTLPFSSSAYAKEKDLGTFGSWKAYAYDEGGQTVCYMVTTKTVKTTKIKHRAPAYLMITHRPIEASTDVVSYDAGTLLASSPHVTLHIGQSSFDFFSARNTAWARDALVDHKIAAVLQHAPTAQVTALPAKKGAKPIRDIFDLTGAEPAYRAIGKACGLSQAKPAAKKPIPTRPSKPK